MPQQSKGARRERPNWGLALLMRPGSPPVHRSAKTAGSGAAWSLSTFDLHHAVGMIRFVGHYQEQAGRPSGAGAKVRQGFRGQRDARFNFDLHAVTEASENLANVLNRVRCAMRHWPPECPVEESPAYSKIEGLNARPAPAKAPCRVGTSYVRPPLDPNTLRRFSSGRLINRSSISV